MYILKIKITKYRSYILLIIKYYPIPIWFFDYYLSLVLIIIYPWFWLLFYPCFWLLFYPCFWLLFYPWFWLLFYPWFWLLFYPWLAGTLHIEPEYDRCVFFLRIHVQNSLKQYFIPCLSRTFYLLLKATILGWDCKTKSRVKAGVAQYRPPPPIQRACCAKA